MRPTSTSHSLLARARAHDAQAWDAVVRDGALRAKGMAAFGEQIDPEQSAAIRAYVVQEAIRGRDRRAATPAENSDG